MNRLTPSEASQLFRDPPEHIPFNGGAVAYRRVGSGPDVLFVHGWPVSGATYRQLLPHLAPHVTCHVIDLVGAGDSRFGRDSELSFDNHVQAVRHVVDTLGLESVSLVGHDSGGLIARHAMAGDPRLRSMVLANTEQPQGLTWLFRNFVLMGKLPGFAHLLAWIGMNRSLRRSPLAFGGCFTDRSLLGGEFEEFFLAPLRDNADLRWATGRLVRTFRTRFVYELGALHQKIDAPVQLVWGENDPFFPLAWAREMVSTFSNAQLHVVSGAKLFVHEERPEEVATAMLPTILG